MKASAPGELLPPNQIVYAEAFDGVSADLLMTWRHNAFEQDLTLNERPALPEGFNPETTEFIMAAEPELHREVTQVEGKPPAVRTLRRCL